MKQKLLTLGEYLNKYIYLIILLLIIFIFYPTSLNMFSHTFNFADNLGYAKSIELLKLSISEGTPFYIGKDIFFLGEGYKILFITPLWQSIGTLFSYVLPTIFVINIVILGSIYLNILCSYFLFSYITSKRYILSFLGAIIFGASSLVLYTTWFNLMGLFFIPLIMVYFLKYIENKKLKDLILFSIFFFLITLSNTYFIPIILLVLFSFYIIYFMKYKKQILLMFIINIIIIICSFLIYKIPFYQLEKYGHPVKIEKLLNTIKISSSIDPYRIFIPNNNNIYSKPQLDLIKNLYNKKIAHFRYSFYIPIVVFLLLFLILTLYILDKEQLKNNTKVGIIITLFSFILLLGDKFIINGYDTGIYSILYYIKLLPNGEIFRKSVYFIYPLTFGISLIIISFFSNKKYIKYNFMFIIITLFVLLMNIGPYYGKFFKIQQNNEIIENIPIGSNILSLPNSGYDNWEFEYNLLKNNNKLKFLEFGNSTLKNIKKYKEGINLISEDLYNIIYNKKIIKNKKCNFGTININYIILYKKYIENFFFYSNKSRIYGITLNNISKCKNIEKINENKDIILYKIN